jgi:hypothetical protein
MPGAGGGFGGGGYYSSNGHTSWPCLERKVEPEEADRIKAQIRAEISAEISKLVLEAKNLSNTLLKNTEIKKLVDDFIAYIQMTDTEISLDEWYRRQVFVRSCLEAISKKDLPALEILLSERKVKLFKSMISTTLYDIAEPLQFFYTRRQQEIANVINKVLAESNEPVSKQDQKKQSSRNCRSGCFSIWSEEKSEKKTEKTMPSVLIDMIGQYGNSSFHEDDKISKLSTEEKLSSLVP